MEQAKSGPIYERLVVRGWLRGSPARIGAATLIGGLLLTWAVTGWQVRSNERALEEHFAAVVERVVSNVQARVHLYEYGLRGMRGAVLSARVEHFNQARFEVYSASRDLHSEFPGAHGMGVIKRVPRDEEAAFVAAARRDGPPDFTVHGFSEHGGDRYVIQYISPIAANRAAIGLDIASESNRRRAAVASMRTGEAALSGPITLVQDTGKRAQAFLLLLPIYQAGVGIDTAEQRERATVGWSYAPLIIDEVLANIVPEGTCALTMSDAGGQGEGEFFSTSSDPAVAMLGIARVVDIPVYGRTWRMRIDATPVLAEQLGPPQPRLVAALGVVLAVLLAALVYLFVQSRRRQVLMLAEQARRAAIVRELNADLEKEVLARTASLDNARRDLRAILDSVPSVISYWDRDLCARFANKTHLPWFGLNAEDVSGMHAHAVWAGRVEVVQPHMNAALRGAPQTFELTLPIPGGAELRHAVASFLPDVVAGEVCGFYAFLTDVTSQVDAQTRLAAALRENEGLLKTIHRLAIVSVTDCSGRITEVNDGFCQISGYTREELLGNSHSVIKSGIHDAAFWRDMWCVISSGRPWRGKICNRAKDGALYWVDSMIAPFLDDEGRIEKYVSIRMDVTAAALAEERLRESRAVLDRAGKVAGVGAWEVDLRTRHIAWSAQMKRIYEVDDDYEPGPGDRERFYSPEACETIDAILAQATVDGCGWDVELEAKTARGRAIWVRLVGEYEWEGGAPVRLVGALQDVTARRQVSTALAQERDLLASLLDNLPDRIHFKDPAGRFLRINPSLSRRFGLESPQLALGRTESELLGTEKVSERLTLERRVLETGQALVDVEEQELRDDGQPRWFLTTWMPFRDAAGDVVGTFGVSRDITALKEVELALQQAHERVAIAADAAGIGIWHLDLRRKVLVWDDWMYRLYGLQESGKEAPYELWSQALHPDDRARSEEELQAAIRGESVFDTEFRIIRPDGATRYLKASARVLRGADGTALGMVGVNFDLSDRKRVELELRETTSLLTTVLDSASEVSIIATDAELEITVFNSGAERLLGYTRDEVVNKATPLLIHDAAEIGAYGKELSREAGRVIEGSAVFTDPVGLRRAHEWSYLRKGGGRVPVSLTVTAMHTSEGQPLGYLGIARDVTREREHEASLREAMQKAEQASLAKSQFLANMSHEIRTPMNAVIGLTYLLGQTALDSDQAALLSKVRTAGKSLLSLINDILDLSKIEAGELLIERAPFALTTLLDEVREVMDAHALSKGIGFELTLPADVPVLDGDSNRVRQILLNLVSNAIKFTERGLVRLRVRQEAASDTEMELRFEVEDSGIGIPAEVQSRLFTPFSQADASTTRRFGGTGLGLSIVKHLAELMGGSVGLSSTPGLGSTFWASLKFPVATDIFLPIAPEAVQPGGCQLMGVRILVVDDSDINLEVAKRVLELGGASVGLASNGQEAYDILRATPQAFDVVLMDLQMPVLGGREATARIRAELKLSSLPIIALTADARTSEREQTRAAGMDDFVTKPFEPHTLVGTILRHVAVAPVLGLTPMGVQPSSSPSGPTSAWPALEGIDEAGVRARLAGDVELFHTLLDRMLEEFAELAVPLVGTPGDQLADYAARMHKLKGVSGQLGAVTIHEYAARAEVAYKEGDLRRGAQLARLIKVELRRLGYNVECAFPPPASRLSVRCAETPADPNVLHGLMEQLRLQELSVIDHLVEIGPQLRALIGEAAFGAVSDHVDSLQFQDALEILDEAASSAN